MAALKAAQRKAAQRNMAMGLGYRLYALEKLEFKQKLKQQKSKYNISLGQLVLRRQSHLSV